MNIQNLSLLLCCSLLVVVAGQTKAGGEHSFLAPREAYAQAEDEELSDDEEGAEEATNEPIATPTKDPTDQKIGGTKVIRQVVDDFLAIASNDERIAKFFENTLSDPVRTKTFKTLFVDQLCEAAGGPCHYLGKKMQDAHAGMKIKNEHFKAMLEDLTAAMEKNNISKEEQVHFVKILAPYRAQIVDAPPKPTPTMSAGGFR